MYNLVFLTDEVLCFFILMSTFSLKHYECKYTHIEFGNIRKYLTTRKKPQINYFISKGCSVLLTI